MNPQASQSSIGCSFSGNASYRPGSTLPRSFKPPHHEICASEALYGLLMAHLRPNPTQCENGLIGHSRTSHGDTFVSYKTSLERSLRMQDCTTAKREGALGNHGWLWEGEEGYFFFRCTKKGQNRRIRRLYTLLDYIALSSPSSKSTYKGQVIKHEILAPHDN